MSRGIMGNWLGAAAVLVLASSGLRAEPTPMPYGFAGLSLDTTAAQLRQRYPQDATGGSYMTLPSERSHDHIYSIQIASPDGSGQGRLRLGFERPAVQAADGKVLSPARHPRCDQLSARLKTRYGPPAQVHEYIEGDTDGYRTRILRWQQVLPQLAPAQRVEHLVLQCGRSKTARWFQADALEISRHLR